MHKYPTKERTLCEKACNPKKGIYGNAAPPMIEENALRNFLRVLVY